MGWAMAANRGSKPNARGIRNHNPGNIERVAGVRWQGMSAIQSDERFIVFKDARWGIRAIARTLITYQDKRRAKNGSRIDSVQEIIDRWAPPHENNTSAYAQQVAKALDKAVNDESVDVYDYHTMESLVCAIIKHENGSQPYSLESIRAGLALAGISIFYGGAV